MTAYVVQTAQATGTITAASGTVSAVLGPVRQGNCLVVVAADGSSGSNGSVSAVRFAGVADNFTQLATSGNTGTPGLIAWWADPSCAGSSGNGTVSAVWGGVSGTAPASLSVLEVGGLMPSASYLLDVAAQGTSLSVTASWNSGTITTGYAPEMWVGAVASGATPTGPAYPWINLPVQNPGFIDTLVGYQLAPNAPGTAIYSGTFASTSAYNAGVLALIGLPQAIPTLPAYIAGFGPQQGDMNTVYTSPLGFLQQRVIFRAAQLSTTTTLPSGLPGAATTIHFDTVYEDPYQGWNPSTFAWQAPYTGWYQVAAGIEVGTAPLNAILQVQVTAPGNQIYSLSELIMPTTGGNAQGTSYIFLVGGQDTVSIQGLVYSGSNVSTATTNAATWLSIVWAAGPQ